MRGFAVLTLIFLALISMPFVFAQDACGNDYFTSGNAESPLSSVSVAPSTGADLSSISSTSVPSAVSTPSVSSGGTNCFDDVIFLGIFWNNDVSTGPSNRIIVNTPNETMAVVNFDEEDAQNIEIRWYNQGGLTPSSLVVPELIVDHGASATHAIHASISNGINTGDMVLAVRTSDGDIHVGRYRATASPTVWQTSLNDTLDVIHFIDYNPAAGVIGILARTSADVVIYTVSAATGAVIDRVAIDSGAGTSDRGHGIRVDDSGDVYISYSAGFPGPYHVLKVDSTPSIVWKTILAPGNSHDQLSDDNLIALVGTNLYAGGNLGVLSGQIFRLSQAAGTVDFQLDLGTDIFLAGMVPAVNLATGVYFYGQNESSSLGALGLITDAGPTNTWFNEYPDFEIIFGVGEGDFARILAVGQDAVFSFGHTAFIVGTSGVLDVGFGDLIDIQGAADLNNNEFSDVVERPTSGFFDVFTVVGDNAGGMHTKVVQLGLGNCGDGAFSFGEACDPGSPGHNDAGCDLSAAPCDFDCTCPICGDFIMHAVLGEECDDGNNVDNDGCSANCEIEAQSLCGNNVVEGSEECDDGNNNNGDGCSSSCLSEKEIHYVLYDLAINHNLLFSKVQDLLHISKDSSIQVEIKVVQYGLLRAFFNPPNGNPCQVLPLLFAMPVSLHPYGKLHEINALNGLWLFTASDPSDRAALGIGDLQFAGASGMEADAESLVQSGSYLLAAQEKCCVYAQLASPEFLSFDPATGICNRCGDGVIAGNEECDPPGGQCDSTGTCSEACTCNICGNGAVEFPEECDDGKQCDDLTTSCTSDSDCVGIGSGLCLIRDGDGCNSDCLNEFCGDGTIQFGEQCDDGNTANGDGCNSNCQDEFCGDNVITGTEECDPPDSECSGGGTCSDQCDCPNCGNDVIDGSEECDGTDDDVCVGECTGACTCPECGDGVLDSGEECDDGNAVDGDGCNSDCLEEVCGDGVADPDGPDNIPDNSDDEQCDDGNAVDGDGCNSDCQEEFCGDGIIQPGEQCEPPSVGSCDANCRTGGGGRNGGGGGNPQLQVPGCADGSEYNLIEWLKKNRSPVGFVGAEWYYIDNGGDKWILNPRLAITVGPTCCADCCSSYCSVLNPRWLCLPPVVYDEKGIPVMLEAPSVCRPAVMPNDAEVCLDYGGLHCLRSEVNYPVAAETREVQVPVAVESSSVQLAECVNSEECTAGFVCQNGACVRKSESAQEPAIEGSRLASSNVASMVGMLLIILAVIVSALVILHSRKRSENPVEPVRPVEKAIVRPVEKPEPVKVVKAAEFDSAKLEADLKDLDKSYKKIEAMLKSMREKL